MKIELIKETAIGKRDWYAVKIDGSFYLGSYIKEEMTALYTSLKNNPEALKPRIEILLSDEIDVPSQVNH